jgi:transposase
MSELQQEVSRHKRRFGEEFKRDAVRLVVEEGYTFKAAAAAVGVSDQSLRCTYLLIDHQPTSL